LELIKLNLKELELEGTYLNEMNISERRQQPQNMPLKWEPSEAMLEELKFPWLLPPLCASKRRGA
jgi:hypothetical protein